MSRAKVVVSRHDDSVRSHTRIVFLLGSRQSLGNLYGSYSPSKELKALACKRHWNTSDRPNVEQRHLTPASPRHDQQPFQSERLGPAVKHRNRKFSAISSHSAVKAFAFTMACGSLPPPATGARGESPVALPRGSERVRSRSATRECSQPRAAFSAVRAPPRTIPAQVAGRHIFRESAWPVAECLRSGRARAEFQWGRPKAGSTNLRETFPREPGTTGARWWRRRRGHLRARLPRSPGAAILSAPGSGAAWAGGLAASRRFRRGTVCLPAPPGFFPRRIAWLR